MNDMMSLLMANQHLGPQHMAQDGMHRSPLASLVYGGTHPDLSQMEQYSATPEVDLLLQELAKNNGAFSSPLNAASISASQDINPILLLLLSGAMQR